jgi:hypothetical protein
MPSINQNHGKETEEDMLKDGVENMEDDDVDEKMPDPGYIRP